MVNPISEYEQLIEDARLGDEARRFLKSKTGKFLIDNISAREKSALDGLRVVDPFDSKEVLKLQNQIEVAVMAKRFLIDAMIIGDNAAARLMEADEEEEFNLSDEQMGGLDGFTEEYSSEIDD